MNTEIYLRPLPRARLGPLLSVLCLGLFLALPLYAGPRIAVLDFELKDLTLDPNTQEEIERTASIKPMLEKILADLGNYTVVKIDQSSQRNADVAAGYLFDHFDAAAAFGQTLGADYILVGRVHKASFLFVYFMLRMIDTRTERLIGNYICEVKGPQKKLTVKGAECLIDKIDKTLHPD
ncbi:MAG: DUF3280 domain-containing protein [Methylococcaceae bacterium]|nr:DUF3280 domain-containing protein [Methylococcaceae bacterium]MCI0732878.1 DUF3280 domain-containing protein [Methylococcaceae bacterium]